MFFVSPNRAFPPPYVPDGSLRGLVGPMWMGLVGHPFLGASAKAVMSKGASVCSLIDTPPVLQHCMSQNVQHEGIGGHIGRHIRTIVCGHMPAISNGAEQAHGQGVYGGVPGHGSPLCRTIIRDA